MLPYQHENVYVERYLFRTEVTITEDAQVLR